MNKRKENRLKALIVTVVVIAAVLITIHVFGNFVIPWIIEMHS